MKKNKVRRGNPKPIKTPAVIMYIKGRIDARNDESVAKNRLNMYSSKVAANETLEVTYEEHVLAEERVSASNLITHYENIGKLKANIPEGEESFIARERATRKFKKYSYQQDEIKKELSKINENLVHRDTLLCEFVERARQNGKYKIYAYLRGLRAGGLDLTYDENPSKPYEIYKSKHKIDKKILNIITIEGEIDEIV